MSRIISCCHITDNTRPLTLEHRHGNMIYIRKAKWVEKNLSLIV
jgi:hypothetical protein